MFAKGKGKKTTTSHVITGLFTETEHICFPDSDFVKMKEFCKLFIAFDTQLITIPVWCFISFF